MNFKLLREFVDENKSIDFRSAMNKAAENMGPSEEENMYTTINMDDIINGSSNAFDASMVVDYLAKGQYLYAGLCAMSAIPEIGEIIGKSSSEVIQYIDKLFPRSGEDPEVYTDTVSKSDLRHAIQQYDVSNPGNIDQVFDHLSKMSKAVKSGRQRIIDAVESWVNNTPVKQEIKTKNKVTQNALSESINFRTPFSC